MCRTETDERSSTQRIVRIPYYKPDCARDGSTRLNKEEDENKSRFKTTTCAIHIDEEEAP